MMTAAERYDAPMINYDVLCTAPSPSIVVGRLDRGWIGEVVNVGAAVAEIMGTRRYTRKPNIDVIHSAR